MLKFSSMYKVLGLAGLALSCTQAVSQDYPNKAIRMIVASNAGTTVDNLARAVSNELSKVLGQTIVIDNRSGAGQVIGMEGIARSAPDGYTIGILGVDGIAMAPLAYQNLRFDPLKEIPPIASVAETRYVLNGSSARPWKTFKEIIDYAKANPGKLNYGASAPQVRYGVMVIMQQTGTNMTYVPYSGGAAYLVALGAGTVDLGMAGVGSATTLGSKVRVYAVTGQTRSPRFPDAPTFTELGFPRVWGTSYSMNGPAGLPRAVIDRLTTGLRTALQRPELITTLNTMGFDVTFEPADGAARELNSRAKAYADFAKTTNLIAN